MADSFVSNFNANSVALQTQCCYCLLFSTHAITTSLALAILRRVLSSRQTAIAHLIASQTSALQCSVPLLNYLHHQRGQLTSREKEDQRMQMGEGEGEREESSFRS